MPRKTFPTPWKPTGCGSYRELREGVFLLNWRPLGTKGPRKQKTVSCTEEEAIQFLSTQAVNRSRAKVGMSTETDARHAIELYKERIEAKGNREKYIGQVVALLQDLFEFSSAQNVGDVQAQHIEYWLDEKVKAAKKAGRTGWARTANKERTMINAFFRWHTRHHRIPFNPVDAVDEYREPKNPPRALTPAEYAQVWKVSEPSVRDLMDFFLISAARFEEVQTLKHADIKNGIWTATDRKGKDFFRQHLPDDLLAIVARQPKEEDGLVFHRYVTRKPGSAKGHGFRAGASINNEWWSEVLENRCALADVEKFTSHDLRHCASTWAVAKGCSPWYIQSLLGHADLRTTLMYVDKQVLEGTKVVQKALLETREKALQSHTA